MRLFIIHKTTRDDCYETMSALYQAVESTTNEVRALTEKLAKNPSGGPAQEVEVDGIPVKPKKEDYEHLHWWRQSSWQPFRNGEVPNESGIPTTTLFMENEFGRPIDEDTKEELRGECGFYWNQVVRDGDGDSLGNWNDLGLNRKEDFRIFIESKFPWLRLCAGHWKTKQVWVNYYGRWRRDWRAAQAKKQDVSCGSSAVGTPIPDAKDAMGPMPSTDVPTSNVNVPTSGANDRRDTTLDETALAPKNDNKITSSNGKTHTSSKRGREEEEDQGPDQKKQKGKGKAREIFTPTKFHHSRPKPRKGGANMGKVSLFWLLCR